MPTLWPFVTAALVNSSRGQNPQPRQEQSSPDGAGQGGVGCRKAGHWHWEGSSEQAGRRILLQKRKTSYTQIGESGLLTLWGRWSRVAQTWPRWPRCGLECILPSLEITRPQAFRLDKFIMLLGGVFFIFRLITT